MSSDGNSLGRVNELPKPEKYPQGQTLSQDGCAHYLAEDEDFTTRSLLCKARRSSRGHSALRRAQFLRHQDGETPSRRTYQAIPRNGTSPRTAMPRREELSLQDVMEMGLKWKDATFRRGPVGLG